MLLRASTSLVAAALTLLSLPPAAADEIGPLVVVGGLFQQGSNLKTSGGGPANINNCAGAYVYCRFMFGKVPAGKQMIVTQVTCWLRLNPDATPRFAALLTHRGNIFLPHRYTHLNAVRAWPGDVLINAQVQHLLTTGDRPVVEIAYGSGAQTDGYCNIAGQIIDAPSSAAE